MISRRNFLSTSAATGAIAAANRAWSPDPSFKTTKSIRLSFPDGVCNTVTCSVEKVDGWDDDEDPLMLWSVHIRCNERTLAVIEHSKRRGGHFELVEVVP